MKIYTKTGDSGTTGLFGGARVNKDDIRIEAYGTIDELNSFIGVLNTSFEHEEYNQLLLEIQKRLFTIGSNLASDPSKEMITPDIDEADIMTLELAMDNMDAILEPLRNFILPGGESSIAHAHVCRTVCRRAERRVITLSNISPVEGIIIIYLNRLSDFFFVLSRFLGKMKGVSEIPWVPKLK